jgi:hypothetical protein
MILCIDDNHNASDFSRNARGGRWGSNLVLAAVIAEGFGQEEVMPDTWTFRLLSHVQISVFMADCCT